MKIVVFWDVLAGYVTEEPAASISWKVEGFSGLYQT
jgi:hypothetical protein